MHRSRIEMTMNYPKEEDYGDRYNPYLHVKDLIKWIESDSVTDQEIEKMALEMFPNMASKDESFLLNNTDQMVKRNAAIKAMKALRDKKLER